MSIFLQRLLDWPRFLFVSDEFGCVYPSSDVLGKELEIIGRVRGKGIADERMYGPRLPSFMWKVMRWKALSWLDLKFVKIFN
jgi:hypothetical protein